MIVQVYMPITDSDEKEIEKMYEKIEKKIKSSQITSSCNDRFERCCWRGEE